MTVTTCTYFTIEELPRNVGRRTSTYLVRNRRSGAVLATIKWYGPWRQFCLSPERGTVWSAGCLAEVQQFIGTLAAARKG